MDIRTKFPVVAAGVPENIISELKARGADIVSASPDVCASPEAIRAAAEGLMAQTGAEKVNILAFSLCGLAARKLVSRMGFAEKTASVTTLCTPHFGLRAADSYKKARIRLFSSAYIAYDNWRKVFGERVTELIPDTEEMRAFNLRYPNAEGVFCQSCACAISPDAKNALSSANSIVSVLDGENDGFTSVYSALWGQSFRVYRGVSHLDVTADIYAELIEKLVSKGL